MGHKTKQKDINVENMGKGFLGRTGEVGRGRSDIKEGRMIVNQNELYTCMKLSKTKSNQGKKFICLHLLAKSQHPIAPSRHLQHHSRVLPLSADNCAQPAAVLSGNSRTMVTTTLSEPCSYSFTSLKLLIITDINLCG